MAVFAMPQDRRNLLQQHESGASVDDLADLHGCDGRTVLAALKLAEEERSLQQSRDAVYRQRLATHFDALCRAAEDLLNVLRLPFPASGKAASTEPEYRGARDAKLLRSLRSHLPGSPVWKLLRDWDTGYQSYLEALKRLTERIEAVVSESKWEPDAALALTLLVQHMAQGASPPKSRDRYPLLPKIAWRQVNAFLSDAQHWPETEELTESFTNLRRIHEQLSDKLDAIINAVIIPGRCDYCSLHR